MYASDPAGFPAPKHTPRAVGPQLDAARTRTAARLVAYVAAAKALARTYLAAVRGMIDVEAARVALGAAGVDLPPAFPAPGEHFARMAAAFVRGGFIERDDPLLAGFDLPAE